MSLLITQWKLLVAELRVGGRGGLKGWLDGAGAV